MVKPNIFHPRVTRTRAPNPLTGVERARARRQLASWTAMTSREFNDSTSFRESHLATLSDSAIDSILGMSEQFTTPKSISQVLNDITTWSRFQQHYLAFSIFDILFPDEDPVFQTQAYENVLRTVKTRVYKDLLDWRAKTREADFVRVWNVLEDEFTEQDLLPDDKLDIIVDRFAKLEGPDSIYLYTGWFTRDLRYYEQVWALLQPKIAELICWRSTQSPETRTNRTAPSASAQPPLALTAAIATTSISTTVPELLGPVSSGMLLNVKDTADTSLPITARNRTPAHLTPLERAHARRGLDSWRARISEDFYKAPDSKQTVLPDAVIDTLLDKSAQFITPESISQVLSNLVIWDPLLKRFWALQIFDILFPVEDPVLTTEAYEDVLCTARTQVYLELEAWCKTTSQADYGCRWVRFDSDRTDTPLSAAKLRIISERFTSLEGADSIYPVTGWIAQEPRYYELVWGLLRPIIMACAQWKARASVIFCTPTSALNILSMVSSTYDPEGISYRGFKAFHPVATRIRTPAPLTSLERAHARQGLDSWRTKTWKEFEGGSSFIGKWCVLPDDAITDLLDNSAQFTTLESVSRFLHDTDTVDWVMYQTYWTLQIFDILFPVEDPVLLTPAYEAVLRKARIQVRKALMAWRANALLADKARLYDEYGSDCEEGDLLSNAMLDIFEERFTSLDGPFSISYIIPWSSKNRQHNQQIWNLLQPIVEDCARWKDVLSTKAQPKIAISPPMILSTKHPRPSTPATATKPPPVFSETSTPGLLKFMNMNDALCPVVTRTRTPAPLTILERATARQGLQSWRTRISREFETSSFIAKQTVLPDAVINGLIDKSTQFTTYESISQYLDNKVDWYICQKYWCLEIFDILFPVKDPVIATQLYQETLKTAKAQVRRILVAWRTKTCKDECKSAHNEFGFNFTEQGLLSDTDISIIEERFTRLDGPCSIYPLTAWTSWDGIEHHKQVWELLKPIVIHCAAARLYITRTTMAPPPSSSPLSSPSPSLPTEPGPSSMPTIATLPSKAVGTSMTIQENHSVTNATKEQVMKSLRVWRCRTYKSDYHTQNSIFNVEEVMPNSTITQLADQMVKITAANMIPNLVQWKPQHQRYLQEIYEILC